MTDSDTQPVLEPGFFGDFPNTFSVCYVLDEDKSKHESHWMLATNDGTSKDTDSPEQHQQNDDNSRSAMRPNTGQTRPLYAVTNDTSKPHSIILHSGPDSNSNALGFAGERKLLTQTSLIGIPGSLAAVTSNHTETMSLKMGTSSDEIYRWTFPVPTADEGGGHQIETFEWRRRVFDKHRELLRLGTGTWKDLDKHEVVATWDITSYKDDEDARLGIANFMGSGATSEMGPEWRLMAVMTMLRLVSIDNVWHDGPGGSKDVAGLLVRGAAMATVLGASVVPLVG